MSKKTIDFSPKNVASLQFSIYSAWSILRVISCKLSVHKFIYRPDGMMFIISLRDIFTVSCFEFLLNDPSRLSFVDPLDLMYAYLVRVSLQVGYNVQGTF